MKAGRKSLTKYLSAFNGEWKLTPPPDCDACHPIDLVEMNWYIREIQSGQDAPCLWLCNSHAREWGLL